MNPKVVQISALSIERALPEYADAEDAKDIALRACQLALEERHTWLLTTDDERLKSAFGALLLRYHEKRPDIVETLHLELRVLTALSAAIMGIPVDLAMALAELEDREVIGMIKLYERATDEKKAQRAQPGAT